MAAVAGALDDLETGLRQAAASANVTPVALLPQPLNRLSEDHIGAKRSIAPAAPLYLALPPWHFRALQGMAVLLSHNITRWEPGA